MLNRNTHNIIRFEEHLDGIHGSLRIGAWANDHTTQRSSFLARAPGEGYVGDNVSGPQMKLNIAITLRVCIAPVTKHDSPFTLVAKLPSLAHRGHESDCAGKVNCIVVERLCVAPSETGLMVRFDLVDHPLDQLRLFAVIVLTREQHSQGRCPYTHYIQH